MRVNDMVMMQNYSTGSPNSVSTSSKIFEDRYKTTDELFTPVDWNHMSTKSEPKMSDEEFEKAIWDKAWEDAANGLPRGGDSKKQQLRRDYISAASPDRKAAYEKCMKMTGGKLPLNRTIFDESGNRMMHYNASGFWMPRTTPAEQERLKNFNRIYNEAYAAYEAEHGKVLPEPTGPGRVITHTKPW